MKSTDEAILTFAEAFARLGDRKHSELYLEALATIVRMAKAEERHATQLGQLDDAGIGIQPAPASPPMFMH
jgi:hypothetical protein